MQANAGGSSSSRILTKDGKKRFRRDGTDSLRLTFWHISHRYDIERGTRARRCIVHLLPHKRVYYPDQDYDDSLEKDFHIDTPQRESRQILTQNREGKIEWNNDVAAIHCSVNVNVNVE